MQDHTTKRHPNFKNIAGQRFGRLVALEPTVGTIGGRAVWYCQCDCGNAVNVLGKSLRNGRTRSCGCLRFVSQFNEAKIQRRFWSKVKIETPLECWEWQGRRRRAYGQFLLDGKYHQAHRVSYELVHGPIDDGLVVRHACDNPSCVNPSHLHVGTQADNVQDCLDRSRDNRPNGERVNTAKLTKSDVRRARTLARQGESYAAISRRLGTTPENISDVVRRKTWKHVT